MAPKPKPAAGEKLYDEVTVLGLLLVIKGLGGTYNKILAEMSALDGKRSVSSFEHSLRAVNRLAGELFEKQKNGHKLGPGDIGRAFDGTTYPAPAPAAGVKKRKAGEDGGATPKKTKKAPAGKTGGKKAMTPVSEDDDDDDDDDDEDDQDFKFKDEPEEDEPSIFG